MSAYGYGIESLLPQPALRSKAVLQQVCKGKACPVAIAAMPREVQGRHGKARLMQRRKKGAVLPGGEHGSRIKQHDPGIRLGPEFQTCLAAQGAQGVVGHGWLRHVRYGLR